MFLLSGQRLTLRHRNILFGAHWKVNGRWSGYSSALTNGGRISGFSSHGSRATVEIRVAY
jgi:hypothetical protein